MLIHMLVLIAGITELACLVSGYSAPVNLCHKMRCDPHMWSEEVSRQLANP